MLVTEKWKNIFAIGSCRKNVGENGWRNGDGKAASRSTQVTG